MDVHSIHSPKNAIFIGIFQPFSSLSCFQQQFGDALSSSEGHHFAPRTVAGAHLGAKEMCQKDPKGVGFPSMLDY